jgi:Uma2 family endonuclease
MSILADSFIELTHDDPFSGERIVEEHLSYEDFLRHYQGQHAEWHGGRVILVASTLGHQSILSFLTVFFWLYFQIKPIGQAVAAPFSTRMNDEGDMPRREPDMFILLNENLSRLKDTYLEGPADIAIEIVSEESQARDYEQKRAEYQGAGVREYWIIDPLQKRVLVYHLGPDGQYTPLADDAAGRFCSQVLPQFALDPALLWADSPPSLAEALAALKAMGLSLAQ